MAATTAKTKNGGFKLITGDKVLWVIMVALTVISILVVYSSSAKMGYNVRDTHTVTDLLREQIINVIICAFALLIGHKINCRIYGRLAWWLYGFCWLLTLAPYFIDSSINNAHRWIFGVQPNEALKIATVILLARQLAACQSTIDKMRIVPSLNPMKWALPEQKKIWREGTMPILMPVIMACAVILPAHTSAALLVFVISLIMMYVGRVRRTELLKIILLAGAMGMLLSVARFGRTETAGGRFSTWTQTLLESRTNVSANNLTDTERSMIAIYEGGLFGKGAGQSAVRVELTHPECDYTFAFFVEEYGLFMALIVMSFYMWIAVRGIVIFTRCETAFPGLLVLGMVMIVALQALLHIFVSVNFFPETGQTLPFISRGGSSMLFATAAMAIVLSVRRPHDEKSHEKPRGESMLERG